MEPSRNYRLGPLTYTTATDTEEENRHVDFINIIQNVSFGKQKIRKLIKKNFVVGMNKQQRHLLYSSTGQEAFKNAGGRFRISKKRCMSFLFLLKVVMCCGKYHPKTFFSFSFPFSLP